MPSKADYDAAGPFEKGFMAYWFSAWPESEIPSEASNPFAAGSAEHQQFDDGVRAAVIAAQDGEE
jgi:hypothetical protein